MSNEKDEKDWKYTIICICRDATKVTPTCPTGVTPPYADIQPDFPLPLFNTRADAFAIATDEAEDELESLCDGCDEGISFGIAEDDEYDKMRSIKICYYNHEDDTTYVVTERVIVPVAPVAAKTEGTSPESVENEL